MVPQSSPLEVPVYNVPILKKLIFRLEQALTFWALRVSYWDLGGGGGGGGGGGVGVGRGASKNTLLALNSARADANNVIAVFNYMRTLKFKPQSIPFSLLSIRLSASLGRQKFTSDGSKGHICWLLLEDFEPFCLCLFFRVHWLVIDGSMAAKNTVVSFVLNFRVQNILFKSNT